MPSDLAVFALTASSKIERCFTGKSAGLAHFSVFFFRAKRGGLVRSTLTLPVTEIPRPEVAYLYTSFRCPILKIDTSRRSSSMR